MMTAAQLAEVVSRTVSLKRIGQERWAGLCPWHNEKTPSFHIYRGRRGEGRYHCHGACKADGDGIDWLKKVENKSYREAGGVAPDPQIERDRKELVRKVKMLNDFRDQYPDCPVPDEFLMNHPDWMTRHS